MQIIYINNAGLKSYYAHNCLLFVYYRFSHFVSLLHFQLLLNHSTFLQPLSKGLLQRLMFNLCAHSVTRVTLVGHLLNMIRPESEGLSISDGMTMYRLHGCQWNIVYTQPYSANGNIISFLFVFFHFLDNLGCPKTCSILLCSLSYSIMLFSTYATFYMHILFRVASTCDPASS